MLDDDQDPSFQSKTNLPRQRRQLDNYTNSEFFAFNLDNIAITEPRCPQPKRQPPTERRAVCMVVPRVHARRQLLKKSTWPGRSIVSYLSYYLTKRTICYNINVNKPRLPSSP